jgi:hypothetical protein
MCSLSIDLKPGSANCTSCDNGSYSAPGNLLFSILNLSPMFLPGLPRASSPVFNVFFFTDFPVPDGIFSRFTYSSWNSTSLKWKDLAGSNSNTFGINISAQCITGANGAVGKVCELGGTEESMIYFGESALPAKYTLCTVSRYAGRRRQRIFSGSSPHEWFHGHANGYKGIAHYDQWMTDQENNTPENDTDWLIFCGQNSVPWHFFANGRSVGTIHSGAGVDGGIDFGVNRCLPGQSSCNQSDFAIMEVAIWNRSLSKNEMLEMNTFYANMLATSNLGNFV